MSKFRPQKCTPKKWWNFLFLWCRTVETAFPKWRSYQIDYTIFALNYFNTVCYPTEILQDHKSNCFDSPISFKHKNILPVVEFFGSLLLVGNPDPHHVWLEIQGAETHVEVTLCCFGPILGFEGPPQTSSHSAQTPRPAGHIHIGLYGLSIFIHSSSS